MPSAATNLLLGAWLCLAGCANKYNITVRGRDLHHQVRALRENGIAHVPAERTPAGGGKSKEIVEPIRMDQRLRQNNTSLTVSELSAKCGVTPPFAEDTHSQRDCPLVKFRDRDLFVRQTTTRSVGQALFGGFVLGGVGAVIASGICWDQCDDGNWKTASQVVATSALVVAGGFILFEFAKCVLGLPCGH